MMFTLLASATVQFYVSLNVEIYLETSISLSALIILLLAKIIPNDDSPRSSLMEGLFYIIGCKISF